MRPFNPAVMPLKLTKLSWLGILSTVDYCLCEGFCIGAFEGFWQHDTSNAVGIVVF